eukprot:346815_1
MTQLDKTFMNKLLAANGENEHILSVPKSVLDIVKRGIIPKSFGHWANCCRSMFTNDINNERKLFTSSKEQAFKKYCSNSLIPCGKCSAAINNKDRRKKK